MSRAVILPANVYVQLDDGSRPEVNPAVFEEFITAIVNLWQRGLLTRNSARDAQRSRFGPADSTDSFVGRILMTFWTLLPAEMEPVVREMYAGVPGTVI